MNQRKAAGLLIACVLVGGCESQSARFEREARENKLTGELDAVMVELHAHISQWERENPPPLADAAETAEWEKQRLDFLKSEHGELYRRQEELKNELGVKIEY